MTKEELYSSIENVTDDGASLIILDKFFEDKVIIQKGENRHPCADEFHQWVEGETIEVMMIHKGWTELNHVKSMFSSSHYRLKPKEPVLEWKWYVGFMYGVNVVTDEWHTEEEIGKLPFRKMEETKRERK